MGPQDPTGKKLRPSSSSQNLGTQSRRSFSPCSFLQSIPPFLTKLCPKPSHLRYKKLETSSSSTASSSPVRMLMPLALLLATLFLPGPTHASSFLESRSLQSTNPDSSPLEASPLEASPLDQTGLSSSQVQSFIWDILRASQELHRQSSDNQDREEVDSLEKTTETLKKPEQNKDSVSLDPTPEAAQLLQNPMVDSPLAFEEQTDFVGSQPTAEQEEALGLSELFEETESSLSGVVLSGRSATAKFTEGVGGIDEEVVKELMQSVLRIHVIRATPDFGKPWTNQGEARATGSGFPIRGRRIITNAHVTTYAHIVRVAKPGSPRLFDARVISTAHEPDLCVLAVEEEEFWEDLVPLDFIPENASVPHSTIPNILDGVYVFGYPTGGDSLSVTQGIVSRVEVGRYSHSGAYLLEIQIDAAINPGNSGGPVVNADGLVVGVAFQGLTQASNIGYIIPVSTVQRILKDIDLHGKYTGMVSLGVLVQSLRNVVLRTFLGLEDLQQDLLPEGIKSDGVLITDVDQLRVKDFQEDFPEMENLGLKEKDVLLALDGQNVAEDGSISFRNKERVGMSYLLTEKFAGDFISATVFRNKQVLELQVPLAVPKYLVPIHTNDVVPKYLFFGGAVFVTLTKQYILDHDSGRGRLALSTKVSSYQSQFQEADLEEIVVLSRILSSPWTKGYNLQNQIITGVNGTPIKDLKHLASLLGLLDNPSAQVRSGFPSPVDLKALLVADLEEERSTDGTAVPAEGVEEVEEGVSVLSKKEQVEEEVVVEEMGDESVGMEGEKGELSKEAVRRLDVKMTEGEAELEGEREYFKFDLANDNFMFVMDKKLSLASNPQLLHFHRISLPFYLGEDDDSLQE